MTSEGKARTVSMSGGDSESDLGHHDTAADIINSIMNSSQISNASNDSTVSSTFAVAAGGGANAGQHKTSFSITHNMSGKSCRFPKLEECAHFHYERVQLGKITLRLVDEKLESASNTSQFGDSVSQTKSCFCNNGWFIVRVTAGRSDAFLIRRSVENLKMLDELLHQCVYDRKISGLDDLEDLDVGDSEIEVIVGNYLNRFSVIASDAMTCGPVLTWLQLDNKGRRLPVADSNTMRTINTPAVGAAYGVRRYVAQACDEISIEVGDMISVIDMPSPAESVWWRGKKSHLEKSQYEVGFFPQSCVATIGDKVPRHMPLPAPLVGSLAVSPTKPVLRKHGKLIAFFRSFILSRPSRRRLKQSGIYKERVFSCDLSEHLLNSGQDIPMVLKCCADFIEEFGIVDGIYRLSGITSNIQKLRRAFDEERVPDLTHPDIRQDIHAVSSLLKMYFRELPNPLCTYQLYDNFVEAIQSRSEGDEVRLQLMKETVQKLPPPHYRTLKYLSTHLNKISRYCESTGMTDRNLAIVWAPNLLRSPALESGGVAALRGVGVQAVVTEYLITNCELIFNSDDDFTRFPDTQLDSLTDSDSFIDQRDHEHTLSMLERPKSLNVGGAKLISIEEAQSRHNRSDNIDINKAVQLNTSALQGGYIEVGGGPSSLPDKYHTVLPVPRSWQKRKTHSWKSLFTRNPRQSNSNHDIKGLQTTASKISPSEVHISLHANDNETEIEKENKTPNFNGMQSISQGKLSKDGYDGKSVTTMDVCVRSSSIDSLRTAGHSRSVSHDSYFDLLQSPLRIAGLDNSREMSELGLNFDREEPEMRIFSESESLVSSPKVIKEEKVPPRKNMSRARPEEFSSTANSVNPSPKKQPRLNLQSPSNGTGMAWMNGRDDESSCKRYKLEDQLSDIQFIDCNTPEHTIGANNTHATTIYTSVQVHNPPLSSAGSSREVLTTPVNEKKIMGGLTTRYSYPGNRGHDEMKSTASKESRFSYPGGRKSEESNRHFKDHHLPVTIKPTQNRYSYYDTTSTQVINEAKNNVFVLRSNSADVFNGKLPSGTNNRSKLSVATPQSPTQSPRYSLLVGETSSEASSSLNTPTYDHSRNSFENTNNTKDLDKIKKEMSLDLTTTTHSSGGGAKKTLSTPNTPNHTHTSDNTSQSMTPSEFGYQNLNRIQSPAASSENSPKDSITYENVEQNFYENAQIKAPIKATINITYISPTKTKNSIIDEDVYEDVTPVSEKVSTSPHEEKSLLETTFDDKMVYEQVKFYKSTISEINDMVDNGNEEIDEDEKKTIKDDSLTMESESIVPNIVMPLEDPAKCDDFIRPVELDMSTTADSFTDDKTFNEDIAMSSDQDCDVQDSLEFDQNISLYENVHIKQPPILYENVDLANTTKKLKLTEQRSNPEKPNLDLKPSNFMVRQLATKFETSPSENSAPFDFNKQYTGHRKSADLNRNSPCTIRAKNNTTKDLTKQSKITRSLDENAFVREFGSKRLENLNQSHQLIQQFTDFENTLNESRRKSLEFTRPKSLNPPKKLPSLITTTGEICKSLSPPPLKLDLHKSPIHQPPAHPIKITPTTENRISLIQNNVLQSATTLPPPAPSSDDEKSMSSIVSTTNTHKSASSLVENCKLDRERIEKIKEERRHQLSEKFRNESFRETSKPAAVANLYQPMKSKSKTDIRDLKDSGTTTLPATNNDRPKSKSRTDVRSLADNFVNQDSLGGGGGVGGYTTTRIRRISDEKNQNDVNLMSDNLKIKKKLDKRDSVTDFVTRDRDCGGLPKVAGETESFNSPIKCSQISQRDRISPQRSIKDVAAMFESRMQNQ